MGEVFTYEPESGGKSDGRIGKPSEGQDQASKARKIVDVFTVRSTRTTPEAEDKGQWLNYAANLAASLRMLRSWRQQEAQGELVKRIAVALPVLAGATPTLQPVDIEIDNEQSDRYTILRIDVPDTAGFLYEFTNALALNGVHIAQVSVASIGSRVHDVLYVTDARKAGRSPIPTSNASSASDRGAGQALHPSAAALLESCEAALQHFNEYLGELFRRPSWPDELASLERPEVLGALARLLGVSEFLWDDFLRMHANLFPVVEDVDALSSAKTKGSWLPSWLKVWLARAGWTGVPVQLDAFKDREMFRIDMRHILGHVPEFGQFSAELTDLAETVVAGATELAVDEVAGPVRPAAHGHRCAGAAGRVRPGQERRHRARLRVRHRSDVRLRRSRPNQRPTRGERDEFHDKLVTEFSRSIWARREGSSKLISTCGLTAAPAAWRSRSIPSGAISRSAARPGATSVKR